MRLAVVAGIRAQFIKLASLQASIKSWNKTSPQQVTAIYINSGQHYDDDLANSFIDEFEIKFDIDLTSTHKNTEPIYILSNMVRQLYTALSSCGDVDWVVIFGDANTTLAAAIAAAKLSLPLVHVEAGVRVNNVFRSEEQNRIVADHLSIVHFLSAQQDANNLSAEGLYKNVFWVGDLVYDLVLALAPSLEAGYGQFATDRYILSTIHREENIKSDYIVRNIMQALSGSRRQVLFVAHPRTRSRLVDLGLEHTNNVHIVNKLSYKEMLSAIKGCTFLVTDSGALQRESFYLKKRCLIRQDEPFWSYLVNLGVHKCAGTSLDALNEGMEEMELLLEEPYPASNTFGDGSAGLKIIQTLWMLQGKKNIS
jgi:UDP-GlcNAc3NAcA epimerase